MVFNQEAAMGSGGLHHRVATVPLCLLPPESENPKLEVGMRTTVHKLKIWPQYFQPVLNGRMRCQLRRADRDFKVGDHLLLQEWMPPMRCIPADPDTLAGKSRSAWITLWKATT